MLNAQSRQKPTALAAASAGEWTMARLRVLLLMLISIVPTYKLASGEDFTQALGLSYAALLVAVAWLAYLRRREYVPALAYVSVTLDIGFITLGLWLDFVSRETPLALVNNKGTFDLYFLAVICTALRYDRRLSLYGGLLAFASYSALLLFALDLYNPNAIDPRWLARYGELYLPDQISRLIFLLMAMLLAWVLVLRADKLEREALHDPLTGVLNRQSLHQHLDLAIRRYRRKPRPFVLVMLDLDHFKRVNDRFGHTTGDAILTAFAQRLQHSVRAGDIVARYGGEEFCLVLEEAHPDSVATLLNDLRRRLGRAPLYHAGTTPIHLTFSAGVAAWDPGLGEAANLIDLADQRLLQAKRAGRDRIELTVTAAVA
ncbi:GGDEF domain-containing protein [Ferrimonas marina]|uniref:diguanylate cyclase n=1 Tax=Ferrimonas marina TaxID=299255 RepID=A0A1M5YHN0_9GAMM|nr:GGDEF domain-containing protein [Ferrimonas marina]SHI11506.1 diguanylate cyclase (GGDEF) domain-containing protein [Ferrimonas marina]